MKRCVGLKDLQSIITKKALVESAERNGPSWRTTLLRDRRKYEIRGFPFGSPFYDIPVWRPLFHEGVHSRIEQDRSRLGDWDEG